MGYVLIPGWVGLSIGVAFGVLAMILLAASERGHLPESRPSGR